MDRKSHTLCDAHTHFAMRTASAVNVQCAHRLCAKLSQWAVHGWLIVPTPPAPWCPLFPVPSALFVLFTQN